MQQATTTSDGAVKQAVDLDTFMAAIFGGCVGIPVLAAIDFKGFLSQRYTPGRPPRGEQTYFCISTVLDIPRTAILRRRNEDLVKTYCIVLDDVGTKVPVPSVPPTWILESSKGNFQYGYKLAEAIDPPEAAALIEALIAGGHTDPGAGRAERVMRVPGSVNAKPTANGWVSVVREWHPELTYKSTTLAQLFNVAPGEPQPARIEAPPLPRSGDVSDRVFDWLVGHDHVVDGPNPRGWYQITCPWEDEHQTPPYDHGTDYLPGLPGAFKCLHGSCAARSTATLKEWILEQDPDADIGVIPHELAMAVGAALREAFNPTLSLRERLGLAIRGINLGPWLLPDPAATASGAVSMRQAATELRVEHVLAVIKGSVRRNAMNGSVQINLQDYCSDDEPSAAGMATIVHACDRCGMSNAALVKQAVMNIAMAHSYNPAEDWILSKPWDGMDRLGALGATITLREPEFERWKVIALRRWCLQVITAVTNYRLDTKAEPIGFVLVLQGEQGVGKSFWIKSLMPAAFVTLGLSLKLDRNERDSATRATATPIGELAELDASFKHSDISALKNFLTTPLDVYRPPYGDRTLRTPRCTAFAGTINPTTFLHDPTGARRFWPLAVAQCNTAHGIDMQQFWAQMHHLRIVKGEQYWLTAEEEELQLAAVATHEIENEISDIIEDLQVRRAAMGPNDKLIVANIKTLLSHYDIRFLKMNSADLATALSRAKFEKGMLHGRRGFKVPNFTQVLTEAQIAGFKLVQK